MITYYRANRILLNKCPPVVRTRWRGVCINKKNNYSLHRHAHKFLVTSTLWFSGQYFCWVCFVSTNYFLQSPIPNPWLKEQKFYRPTDSHMHKKTYWTFIFSFFFNFLKYKKFLYNLLIITTLNNCLNLNIRVLW